MQVKFLLFVFALAAIAIAAALLIAARPSAIETQTASGRSVVDLPPCSGLEGRELERCQVLKQVRPGEYDTGPDARGIGASSNSARAARGSGIEGVSSANTTTDPPSR